MSNIREKHSAVHPVIWILCLHTFLKCLSVHSLHFCRESDLNLYRLVDLSHGQCATMFVLGRDTTGWPPLVFQGLAPMDQLSKSRTGKLRCLRVVLLVVGILADRSEEAVVKWCHLLRYSFRYFKSGRSVLKRVIIPQQQRSTWGGTGSPTTAWQPETLIRQIERRNPKLSATRFN